MEVIENGPSTAAIDMVTQPRAMKKKMMLETDELRFSHGITLSDEEKQADIKLTAMRLKISNEDCDDKTIHNFFQNKKTMETSELFKALNAMPKGAIHHIHTTAANPIDAYLKLTYDERTYFSQRENLFKVYPLH